MAFVLLDLDKGETLFPLAKIPGELERRNVLGHRRRGGKLAVQTLIRWATSGRSGQQLEVIRIGGSLHTSVEAVFRFFRACTNPNSSNSSLSSAQVVRQHAAAETALDAFGF